MVFALSGFNGCSRLPGVHARQDNDSYIPKQLKESVFDRVYTAARMSQEMRRASLSRSRFFPLSGYENCAMRVENAVSKYFLEYVEVFSPRIFFTFVLWGAKKIYWGLRQCELICWLRDFKKLVSAKKMSLYEGKPQFDAAQFTTSSQFHRLTTLFPIINLWKAKKIDWIDLSAGTCFGESLSALKYQSFFNMRRGFLGFPAEEKMRVKNEVIFIQTIHQIQNGFLSVLKYKKKMESKQIHANDLMTPEVVAKLRFCRFLGSFEPIFDFFCGDCIKLRILSTQKKSKIGQNNPKNRRTLSFATTSPDKKIDEARLF